MNNTRLEYVCIFNYSPCIVKATHNSIIHLNVLKFSNYQSLAKAKENQISFLSLKLKTFLWQLHSSLLKTSLDVSNAELIRNIKSYSHLLMYYFCPSRYIFTQKYYKFNHFRVRWIYVLYPRITKLVLYFFRYI